MVLMDRQIELKVSHNCRVCSITHRREHHSCELQYILNSLGASRIPFHQRIAVTMVLMQSRPLGQLLFVL